MEAEHTHLLFGKWELSDIQVEDPGVRRYAQIETATVHTGGRHAHQQFNKSNLSIVERLINKIMRGEENTGKKLRAYNSLRRSFDIINERTGQNPVQLLIEAIENAGPREETVRLKYGGISVPKAVDTASQRRIDLALMYIAQGARKAAFKSKRPIEECLASEIMAASKNDVRSFSVSKKEEKERVAKAAR
ncbi:MAG: 30S ribosomal protein S7 [Halobacteriota archaeon]